VQGHEFLYNLQHKDCDNDLLKDSSWKGIAGELNAQDKETFTKDTALGEWQGNGKVCVNRP
jgi:hypothetical protein